jgi:hypothetical protein
MARQTRATLKSYFLTGALPTERDFADLIDSVVNLAGDGVSVAGQRLGIGAAAPEAKLAVQGAFDVPLSGTITFSDHVSSGSDTVSARPNTAFAVGQGTRFTSELTVGALVQVGSTILTVVTIANDTHMIVTPSPEPGVAAPALARGNLLSVLDSGGTPQLTMTPSGDFGLGTSTPAVKLHVAGTLMAAALSGDGAAISNLGANQIATGTIHPDRLPAIDAAHLTGTLSTAQLPMIPPSKVSGPLDASQIPILGQIETRLTALEQDVGPGMVPTIREILTRLSALERLFQPTPGTVSWDFANLTNTGAVSTAQGGSSLGATASVSQTGGGPSEPFDTAGVVLITRFFGREYPFLTITATQPLRLGQLAFAHYHNHNYEGRTKPSYQVQLQLDTGTGFAAIGDAFTASRATDSQVATVQFGGKLLDASQFRLRWMPLNMPAPEPDTNTDYFAINKIVLSFTLQPALGSGSPSAT